MSKAVIVAASRTPTGKFLGALSDVPAVELGAITLRETLKRSGLPAELVEEVIHFFGFGPYGLPGSAAPACGVRRVGHRP